MNPLSSRRPRISAAMKIVTWNCQQAFARKAERIFSGAPDIAVIQECSKRSTEMLAFDGYSGLWVGENLNKGIGVFCDKRWTIHALRGRKRVDGARWVVPFEVEGPVSFTLIAVWACAAESRRESYVGQIHKALSESPEWFRRAPMVMAGDFNSSAIFDKNRPEWNHTSMVRELKQRGMRSAYHAHHGEEHGIETAPTFHLYRRADKKFQYHFDYIFLPEAWRISRLEVGRHCDWASDSDHCPVMVEVLC